MLKFYELLTSAAWHVYKFAENRRYEAMRKHFVDKAKRGDVYWQDFFDYKPDGNPFNTADLRDVFPEDDEKL